MRQTTNSLKQTSVCVLYFLENISSMKKNKTTLMIIQNTQLIFEIFSREKRKRTGVKKEKKNKIYI
jgi:hypothetical protein